MTASTKSALMRTILESRGLLAIGNAAEPDVAMSEHEARSPVVLLLRNDAVESDDAIRAAPFPPAKDEAVPRPRNSGLTI